MRYFVGLAINFFAVFFLVRFAPGLAATYSETSSFGADLLFAAVLAFFNTFVFPCLILMDIFPTKLKLAALNGILSYGGFSLIAIIPYGFEPDAPGAVIGGSLTWLVSFIVSFSEMQRWIEKHK